MASDGNCLFRAFAHQLYGTSDLHLIVRAKCFQYILASNFAEFIPNETPQSYCERKSHPGIWGDHLEIQAMAEIYTVAIVIIEAGPEAKEVFRSEEEPSQR